MQKNKSKNSSVEVSSFSCQSIFDIDSTLMINSRKYSELISPTPRSIRKPIPTWLVVMVLIPFTPGFANARFMADNTREKRSFSKIRCGGVYDHESFKELDDICYDCYNLFRRERLMTLCRNKCFTTDFFEGCIDVLLKEDRKFELKRHIEKLHGMSITKWLPEK